VAAWRCGRGSPGSGWRGRRRRPGQPLGAGRVRILLIPARMIVAQRDRPDRCRMVRRPCRAMLAGIVNRRWRTRFGSHRRASFSGWARSPAQASRSPARATIAHQMRFWVNPLRGRLRSPASFACRMRSSQRAGGGDAARGAAAVRVCCWWRMRSAGTRRRRRSGVARRGGDVPGAR